MFVELLLALSPRAFALSAPSVMQRANPVDHQNGLFELLGSNEDFRMDFVDEDATVEWLHFYRQWQRAHRADMDFDQWVDQHLELLAE